MIAPALLALLAGADPIRVTSLPRIEDHEFTSALLADMNLDGALDLLVTTAHPELGAQLQCYLRSEAGLASVPTWTQALPKDVVAYAAGDLTDATGGEVLLLAASGAFALCPGLEERERFVSLGSIEFLWQAAREGGLMPWPDAVADVDGDGDADLVIPEPGGYRVLRQARSEEGAHYTGERLELGTSGVQPELQELMGRLAEVQPAITRGWGPLVQVTEAAPAPFLVDMDGDGRLDLVAQDRGRRVTWRGLSGGFERREESLPFEVDLERDLDVSWASHVVDLDGKGGLESILVARERRDGSDRTQVLVYGESFERPRQVLILQGLVVGSLLLDMDGDGARDLVTFSLGDDLFEALGAGGSNLEFTINVFANEQGTLGRRPVLVERIPLDPEQDGDALRLCADATGDGSFDLLRMRAGGKLELLPLLARGDDWRLLLDRPVWSHTFDVARDWRELGGAPERSAFASFDGDSLVLLEVGR